MLVNVLVFLAGAFGAQSTPSMSQSSRKLGEAGEGLVRGWRLSVTCGVALSRLRITDGNVA